MLVRIEPPLWDLGAHGASWALLVCNVKSSSFHSASSLVHTLLCLLTSVSQKAPMLPEQLRCIFPWQLACVLLQIHCHANAGGAELAQGRQQRQGGEQAAAEEGTLDFHFHSWKFTSETCSHLISHSPETRTKSGRAGSCCARSGTWIYLFECLVKG